MSGGLKFQTVFVEHLRVLEWLFGSLGKRPQVVVNLVAHLAKAGHPYRFRTWPAPRIFEVVRNNGRRNGDGLSPWRSCSGSLSDSN